MQPCRVWASGRHYLVSLRYVVHGCHVQILPFLRDMSQGSITTRMVPLFFGCRRMIIPVRTFSSEWYMYVEVQWNVDAFSLSLIFPASRWTFFSEQDPTKYVIKPPSSYSFNGYWFHISVEMSSESCHHIQSLFSSWMNVASSINQPHLPMDLYPSRETEQSLWRRMIHPTWLTVYFVIGRFWIYFLCVFGFSESTFFLNLVCELPARQHTITDCLY